MDAISWRLHLHRALETMYGAIGLAMELDLLHLEGNMAWVRVMADDFVHFRDAITTSTQYEDGEPVTLKVVRESSFFQGLVAPIRVNKFGT